MLATEGSYHRIRDSYIWWTRDMGYRLCIHPRRRAEKIWKILRHRGAKERQELAVSSWVVAEIRDQTPKEGTSTSWDPDQAFLAVGRFSFPFITPHGLLPLMISQLLYHFLFFCAIFFCHIVAVKFICHLLCLTPLYTSIYRHRTKKLGLVGLVLMSSCCPARSSLLFVSDNLMPEFSPCHSQRVL